MLWYIHAIMQLTAMAAWNDQKCTLINTIVSRLVNQYVISSYAVWPWPVLATNACNGYSILATRKEAIQYGWLYSAIYHLLFGCLISALKYLAAYYEINASLFTHLENENISRQCGWPVAFCYLINAFIYVTAGYCNAVLNSAMKRNAMSVMWYNINEMANQMAMQKLYEMSAENAVSEMTA